MFFLGIKISASYFYPRPPSGGRQPLHRFLQVAFCISIHALRVEGDKAQRVQLARKALFLSTPSEWRATCCALDFTTEREYFYPRPPSGGRPMSRRAFDALPMISIHALRVEGDRRCTRRRARGVYFYPRPPSGGRRHHYGRNAKRDGKFLSTPSEWRATKMPAAEPFWHRISIHALRVEGDLRYSPGKQTAP